MRGVRSRCRHGWLLPTPQTGFGVRASALALEIDLELELELEPGPRAGTGTGWARSRSPSRGVTTARPPPARSTRGARPGPSPTEEACAAAVHRTGQCGRWACAAPAPGHVHVRRRDRRAKSEHGDDAQREEELLAKVRCLQRVSESGEHPRLLSTSDMTRRRARHGNHRSLPSTPPPPTLPSQSQ